MGHAPRPRRCLARVRRAADWGDGRNGRMSTRLSRAFTGVVVTLAGALVPAHVLAGPGIGGGGGSGGTGSEADGTIIASVTYATGGGGGGSCVWERIEGELGVEN